MTEFTPMVDDVSCDAYILNVTSAVRAAETRWSGGKMAVNDDVFAAVVNNMAEPAVCVFGIAGNILNLIVLTRKQLQSCMDGLERSVRLGLVALAVSDMLFCILYLMTTCFPSKLLYLPHDNKATLYFRIYQEGLINTFQLTSTWLTVNMALGRYIAICHPLHARGYIRPRGTRIAVLTIVIASMLFNIPRFCHYRSVATPCEYVLLDQNVTNTADNRTSPAVVNLLTSIPLLKPDDCDCFYYHKKSGMLYQSATFRLGYALACAFVEIFLPLLLLTVCNVCLIRALRRSYRMQSLYRTNQKPVDSAHRITPTLIALIVLFTILVTPSNVLTFVTTTSGSFQLFATATRVAHFMLLSNFAVNFVLYLVVNVEFRRVTTDLVTCRTGESSCTRRDPMESRLRCTSSGGPSVSYRLADQKTTIHTDVCNISETEIPL